MTFRAVERRVQRESRQVYLKQLAVARQQALENADKDRKEARDHAHAVFVAGVRSVIGADRESVSSAADAVGLSRGVLHDLIKRYS